MSLRSLCLAAALSIPSSGTSAGSFDETRLFQRGAWSVSHTYDASDGTAWCSADTGNRGGQWFSVVAYDSGDAAVFVGDPAWNLSERSVRYRIDIDYEQWTIDGTASGSAVSVFLNGDEDAAAFLEELMRSSAVAAYNEDGRRLAAFSLAGSRAALEKLAECWGRIVSGDPFRSASDPF